MMYLNIANWHKEFHLVYTISKGCHFTYLLGCARVDVLDGVRLLGENLNGAVVVDGDGARRHEELLRGALLLEDGHHAGSERGVRVSTIRKVCMFYKRQSLTIFSKL